MRGAIFAVAVALCVQGCGGGGSSGQEASVLQLNLSDPYHPVVARQAFQCRDLLDRPVIFTADPTIADVAYSIPVTIVLNPNRLAAMPPALQYFWVGHECVHHELFTGDEVKADCLSISAGKRAGLFNRRDVEGFEPWFVDKPGSSQGHLPGPLRYQNLLACYDAA
jgi:hypothetical protein